jgi:hypothetical protein
MNVFKPLIDLFGRQSVETFYDSRCPVITEERYLRGSSQQMAIFHKGRTEVERSKMPRG